MTFPELFDKFVDRTDLVAVDEQQAEQVAKPCRPQRHVHPVHRHPGRPEQTELEVTTGGGRIGGYRHRLGTRSRWIPIYRPRVTWIPQPVQPPDRRGSVETTQL